MEQKDYWAACSQILEEMSQVCDWYSWYGDLCVDTPNGRREELKKLFKNLEDALTRSEIMDVVFGEGDATDAQKIIRILSGSDVWSVSGIRDGVEKAAWEKYNFSAEEATLWRLQGFSPHQSYRWSRESPSPTKRYTCAQATKWRDKGFSIEEAWPSSWEPDVATECMKAEISDRQIDAWKFDSADLLTKVFHITDPYVQLLIRTDFKPEHFHEPCWWGMTPQEIWKYWSEGIRNPQQKLDDQDNLVKGEPWVRIQEAFDEDKRWQFGRGSVKNPEDRAARRIVVTGEHPLGASIKITFNIVGDVIRAVSCMGEESYWHYNVPAITAFLRTLENPRD